MLSVNSIFKSYGINTVLSNITFTLNPGEKAALVGPNGCGKSTLLRILAGQERADSGSFYFNPPELQPGYLPQGADFPSKMSLGETLNLMQGDLPGTTRRLEELATALATEPNRSGLQEKYDACLARLAMLTEYSGQAAAIIAGFGLDRLPSELPVNALSGGQKTRLQLAGILLSNPRLLMLDEPTNHLDEEMLEWLEGWLKRSPCAVLLVSHDRVFLDRVVHDIYEIDPATHHLKVYTGNYSAYLDRKAQEREHHLQEYRDQQDEIAHLKASARQVREKAQFRKGSKGDSGDKFAKGFFANRSLGTIRRAKAIEARVEKLLGENHIDKPRDSWHMKMEFDTVNESGRDVLVLNNLSVGYPGNILINEINAVLRYKQRVVLSGTNGSGKTSLLRTILNQIPPLEGHLRLGSGVKIGFMAQEQEDLDDHKNPLGCLQSVSNLNETGARTFLHKYLFSGDEVFTPVSALSYGQRSRLSLARLVVLGCNLLLLDEPLNHLDLSSRAQFEHTLAEFKGTVLMVTHDRYFIQKYATHIWAIRERTLTVREK